MSDRYNIGPLQNHREVTIDTLSSPPISIPPAPLRKRWAATVVDSIILTLLWLVLRHFGYSGTAMSLWWSALSVSVLTFLYYFLTEWVFSATPGKHIFKLRVLGTDGDPCSALASLKRNLLRFVDWLPFLYLIGTTSILLSSRRQRLGDRMAATIVSVVPPRDSTPPPAPFLFH